MFRWRTWSRLCIAFRILRPGEIELSSKTVKSKTLEEATIATFQQRFNRSKTRWPRGWPKSKKSKIFEQHIKSLSAENKSGCSPASTLPDNAPSEWRRRTTKFPIAWKM